MQNPKQQPVFVVGCARSGTTLLAGLLSSHSRLICGPETEFFTGLHIANQGDRLCVAATWPEAAADYLFSKVHEKPIPDYYGITRAEIIAYLKNRERSCPAILESLTETYMKREGKHRWVEKTPTHLICLREVRRHYPYAPVVRIVRDPRDVALSLLNVPWGPSSFAAAVLYWRFFDDLSASFFEADRNTLTLRFEDVVLKPEVELRKLCDFLDEKFEPGMMDTAHSIGHLNPTKISWKQNAGQQIDPGRTAVWQRETTAEQQSQAEAIAGDRMKAYGYSASFQFSRYLHVLNLGELPNFPALVAKLLDGDSRFWQVHPRERPHKRFFLGDPSQNAWLGITRFDRVAKVCAVAGYVAHSAANGIPVMWLGAPPVNERQNWGVFCRVLAKLLPKQLEVDAFSGEFAASGRLL